jgi:hypothetical protein
MNIIFSLPSPSLQWNKNNPDMWIVAEDFNISIFGVDIQIPKGFKSDLASIPNLATLCFKTNGLWTPAAIVHDYLYQDTTLGISRELADLIFLVLMLAYTTPPYVAFLFYYAVRLFGGVYAT